MSQKYSGIVKLAGVGMAMGAAAGIAGGCIMNSRRRSMKRRAHMAANAVSDLMSNIGYMFK